MGSLEPPTINLFFNFGTVFFSLITFISFVWLTTTTVIELMKDYFVLSGVNKVKMPRNKKRKSEKGLFSPVAMKDALKLVSILLHSFCCQELFFLYKIVFYLIYFQVREGCKVRTAAKTHGLSHATLQRYVKKTKNIEEISNAHISPGYNTKQVFTAELEAKLAEYIVERSQLGYGLTAFQIRQFAYEYAMANNSNIPGCWTVNKRAGEDWFGGFMRRHPNLSARKPEQCSVARAMAFNKQNIENYFVKLEAVLKRHENFRNGSRVFNLDETATTTVGEMKKVKVIGEKGVKQLHQIKSAERGILVTTCCIICASGAVIPPVMVFPRVKFTNHMTTNAYPGTLGLATKRGWMMSEVFVDVVKHFIRCTGSTKENPSLLILDNVQSHLSIEAIDLCRDKGVTLFTLPPHTTHKTQPLDVGLFGPFQTAYSRAYNSWTVSHPGQVCSIYEIAGLVNEALSKAATPANIFSAFKATGIFPFNNNIFSDVEFVPSTVTQKDPPEVNPPDNNAESQPDEDDPPPLPAPPPLPEPVPLPAASTAEAEPTIVTPRKIVPLPKAKPKERTRKPREKGRCRVATDSAEKNEIEEKSKAKKQRDEEAENRKKERARKNLEKLMEISDNRGKAGKRKNMEVTTDQMLSSNRKKRKQAASKEKQPAKKSRKSAVVDSSESEGDPEIQLIGEDYQEVENVDKENKNPGNFLPLEKSPEEGEHILVQFQLGKESKYYVAKVLKEEDGDGDVEVSYYRKSDNIANKFSLPHVPDLKSVHISNVKKILPKPQSIGTARLKSMISFNFDFTYLRMG